MQIEREESVEISIDNKYTSTDSEIRGQDDTNLTSDTKLDLEIDNEQSPKPQSCEVDGMYDEVTHLECEDGGPNKHDKGI